MMLTVIECERVHALVEITIDSPPELIEVAGRTGLLFLKRLLTIQLMNRVWLTRIHEASAFLIVYLSISSCGFRFDVTIWNSTPVSIFLIFLKSSVGKFFARNPQGEAISVGTNGFEVTEVVTPISALVSAPEHFSASLAGLVDVQTYSS
jgi:hypothetical protein